MPVPSSKSVAVPERPLLRHVVEERIRAAIMDGTLQPGEILNDRQLQDWMGVSRTPIRDALNELARAGLVEMEPNRYTRVSTPRTEDTLDAARTLGVLASGAIRLGEPLLSDAARSEVILELEKLQSELREEQLYAARDRLLKLWDLLIVASGNRQLHQVYRDASSGLFHRVPPEFFVENFDREIILEQFADLTDAIGNHDTAEAQRLTEALHQLNA